MSHEEIRTAVLEALTDIAPDIDPARVKPDDAFRETWGLDSMDFLNMLRCLYERYHVDVPESDYPQLVSIEDVTRYFEARLAGGGAGQLAG